MPPAAQLAGTYISPRDVSSWLKRWAGILARPWESASPSPLPAAAPAQMVRGLLLLSNRRICTEGADGRIFEVTREREIVWEYVSPFFYTPGPSPIARGSEDGGGKYVSKPTQQIYRAYRVPYEWVPQHQKPHGKGRNPSGQLEV